MKIQALTSFQGKSFLDKIHESTKNSADMTDSIVVPRTIFKGYLGIMGGTTLVTLGNLMDKTKYPKLFKGTMAWLQGFQPLCTAHGRL